MISPLSTWHVENHWPSTVAIGLTEEAGYREVGDARDGEACEGHAHEGRPLLGAGPMAEQVVDAGKGQPTGEALQYAHRDQKTIVEPK